MYEESAADDNKDSYYFDWETKLYTKKMIPESEWMDQYEQKIQYA